MLSNVPEEAIRNMAFDNYEYSVVINKKLLLEAIDRILLFTESSTVPYGKFDFNKNNVILSNMQGDNSESVYYENESNNDITYSAIFDLADFKLIVSGVKANYIILSFGNNQAVVLIEDNIYNLIPECIT
jgi:hypothetical protein